MHGLGVRAARPDEERWVAERLRVLWGSTTVISRGRAHDAAQLRALIAETSHRRVGLATLRVDGQGGCELVTLDAFTRGAGVGTALLRAAAAQAAERGCRRLWLITSNDNLDAVRFYQRRGLRIVAVHPGAIDAARELKPSIPMIGEHGIAIHDELELELAPLTS